MTKIEFIKLIFCSKGTFIRSKGTFVSSKGTFICPKGKKIKIKKSKN